MITRVRGTEDLLDLKLYTFMIETIKHHLAIHNFNQIETPILEPTELFIRSVGSDTDIVSKEMYVFQTASGESICLRPEGTAGIIRAYVENGLTQQAPWKVYIIGPMFRHERPQKGRWRQFSQVSIELINATAIEHDVLFLKMLDALFSEKFKLENYVLKLNFLGCLDDRRAHRSALLAFLDTHSTHICATCTTRKDKNTLRVFDCKNEDCQALYKQAPLITDHLCTTCGTEWQKLRDLLSILSISFQHDPMLVRGLDYYNKTVFEFSSRDLGAQNAFCGGGRYSLGKEVGGKDDFSSFGVGIGIGRLLMLVEQNQHNLTIPQAQALHVVVPFTETQKPLALLLADQLLANNLATEVLVETSSVSNMMKKANKLGAKYALLIGPDEQKKGMVTIKNMVKGETSTVKQADVLQALRL